MNKEFVYRHYSGGTFIGLLNPENKFEITKEVNTLGSQLVLELPVAFESTSSTIAADNLIDENGDAIVDENADNILLSFDYDIEGIPNVSDRVEVTEYSDDYPDGLVVYDGIVTRWESGYQTNMTTVYAMSYGVQLDNYIVQILPGTVVEEQAVYTNEYTVYGPAGKSGPLYDRLTAVSQTFTTGTAVEISKVPLYMRRLESGSYGSILVSVDLVQGNPSSPGSTLGTATAYVPTSPTLQLTEVQFLVPVSIAASTEYYINVSSPEGGNSIENNLLAVGYNSAGGYASGQAYLSNETSGITTPGTDLAFQIVAATGASGNDFNSYDPSQIVRELLDNAIALGANVVYTEDSIQDTGTTVSYTFKYSTYYEAIKKCVDLAPANWYFYIDPGTRIVYFQSKSDSPSHVIVNGKHASNFVVGRSLEDVKNVVYFVGGDSGGGENLLISDLRTDSVSRYGYWLETVTDNRVTTSGSAAIIVSSKLDEKSQPRFYITQLIIPVTAYDVTTYRPGQSVGFNNYNDVVNTLIQQILSIEYKGDNVVLKLEVMAAQSAKRVEDIRRNLLLQQTENNPDL